MLRYAVTELGTLGGAVSCASAINALGVVVGKAQTRDGAWRAVMWTEGETVDLGRLPGTIGSEARGLNARGHVVGLCFGRAAGACRPFLWRNEEMVDLGDLGGWASSSDINSHGQIVGGSFAAPRATTSQHHAVLWPCRGAAIALPSLPGSRESHAWGINDAGLIVGVSQRADGTDRAVLWRDDGATDLGTLGGADAGARAVSEEGAVTGAARTRDGALHAFVWLDGTMTDLGAPEGSRRSQGLDLNAWGHVVGAATIRSGERETHRALLWREGALLDLNTLVDDPQDWELIAACGINDRGEIVGEGVIRGRERGFLLTPSA